MITKPTALLHHLEAAQAERDAARLKLKEATEILKRTKAGARVSMGFPSCMEISHNQMHEIDLYLRPLRRCQAIRSSATAEKGE